MMTCNIMISLAKGVCALWVLCLEDNFVSFISFIAKLGNLFWKFPFYLFHITRWDAVHPCSFGSSHWRANGTKDCLAFHPYDVLSFRPLEQISQLSHKGYFKLVIVNIVIQNFPNIPVRFSVWVCVDGGYKFSYCWFFYVYHTRRGMRTR